MSFWEALGTCMFATVHLEVREFEVALVASRIGAHERPLLVSLGAHDGWSDARDPSDILQQKITHDQLRRTVSRFILKRLMAVVKV